MPTHLDAGRERVIALFEGVLCKPNYDRNESVWDRQKPENSV
jgi:hypothetical protein